MASGVNGVCRQLGIAFGIALLGAVLGSQYNSAVHDKVSALQFDHLPAAQQASIKQSIIHGIQQAGTFAGSTGFRHLPPQYAQFANQPNFPAIQQIVQQAFIDGLVDILRIAAVILAVGALAALLLVRKRDMIEHIPGEEPVASVGG
jgi:hypothetical protein